MFFPNETYLITQNSFVIIYYIIFVVKPYIVENINIVIHFASWKANE